ncbi:hypothetical protein HHK36_015686 [Tetracentron sinense]|uniref:Uncharacterized protein n=1 Tax=Tetracentron sinense TaxID=13715 RepID=A0A834Z3I9_TETSI|nr:hypothetical protein HHK36_015686 [Tetracentron sinense]
MENEMPSACNSFSLEMHERISDRHLHLYLSSPPLSPAILSFRRVTADIPARFHPFADPHLRSRFSFSSDELHIVSAIPSPELVPPVQVKSSAAPHVPPVSCPAGSSTPVNPKFTYPLFSQVTEALAIRHGLMLAREYGMDPLMVESDAKVLLDALSCPDDVE